MKVIYFGSPLEMLWICDHSDITNETMDQERSEQWSTIVMSRVLVTVREQWHPTSMGT